MTLKGLKERCMAQIGGDLDDLRQFLPELHGYLNAGYDLLVGAYEKGAHLTWPRERLEEDDEADGPDPDAPALPPGGVCHPCRPSGKGRGARRRGTFPALIDEPDVPALPEWTHWAIADYASYLLYRNGNPERQQRGIPFLRDFTDLLNRLRAEGGKRGNPEQFVNLYTYMPELPAAGYAQRANGRGGCRSARGGFDPLEV